MNKLLSLFLLSYYSIGVFCLPLGEFSFLRDLPAMYQHCQSAEDKDMNCFDFITDHLINIDGLFDEHDQQDEQRPHSPLRTTIHAQQTIYDSIQAEPFPEPTHSTIKNTFFQKDDQLTTEPNSEIFHPPVLC